MTPAPLPADEVERLDALRQYDVLEDDPETDPAGVYDNAARLAAYVCGTPAAAVTLVDRERQRFKAAFGWETRELPRELTFCAHTILQPDLLIVPDALADDRFADHPFVTGEYHLRFYAGVPLVTPEGHALGALCVLDRTPRTLTDDQREALRLLARQVMAQFALRREAAERGERFRVLFGAVTQGIVCRDRRGAITDVNPAGEAMLGRTAGQMRGRTASDLGWRTDGDGLLEVHDPTLGQARRFFVRSTPQYCPGEAEPCRVYSVLDDVTGRREAELEQRQSGESLRLLGAALRSAVDGIVIADARRPDSPLIYCNPAFLALTGYAEHEVLGRNCRFLQGEGTDPDARRRLREALEAGRTGRVTLQNYRKDGTPFWNDLTVAPILDGAGAVTHYVGVQHDVSEVQGAAAALRGAAGVLRTGSQRLRLALESGRLGAFELNTATGDYLEISETCRAQFGLAAGGRYSRREFYALVHPDDRAALQAEAARAAAAGEAEFTWEYRIVRPDGAVRWIGVHGTQEYDAAGRPVRLVGMTQDVTDRKEREADRERALSEAEEQADRDPLTDALNHRAFQRQFADEADRARRTGAALAVVVLDVDDFRFFNDLYGHGVGDEVLRALSDRLRAACGPGDVAARFGGDEFALLLPDVGPASALDVEARLRAGLGEIVHHAAGAGGGAEAAAEASVTVPVTFTLAAALVTREAPDRHEALRLAQERLRWLKTGGGAAGGEGREVRAEARSHVQGFFMLDALVSAVDNKDRYTRRHSEDVLDHSLRIAHALGLDDKTRHAVGVAALLHDVGKIGVPDAILRKPGRLSDEEYEAVKQHPMMGAIIVGAVPGLEQTLDAVRHHHERWDGDGYPFGLVGEETPLSARIMAVADAYSAMTTDRPYRKGMGPEKARRILSEGAGTQWDPACVAAFLEASP